MKKNKLIFLFILLPFLFTHCKKEAKPGEFEGSKGNLFKVYNIDSLKGITAFASFNRQSGGNILLYQPSQARGVYENLTGMIAVATNEEGEIIRSSFLGGSGDTYIWGTQMDDYGNVYLSGKTNSLDIRKDIWVDSSNTDKSVGYLAKLDKDANILWQITYCDTTTPQKGRGNEEFWGMELLNNKPICIGPSYNYDSTTGPKLVFFDENGNFTKYRLFPPLYKGSYAYEVLNINAEWQNIITLADNDLIIRNVYTIDQYNGVVTDTGSYLCRYNPVTDKIVWQKYFLRNTPQADLTYCGLLGNGNLAFFDFFFNTLNILDVSSGNTLSTKTIHNNKYSQGSLFYYNILPYTRFNLDGNLYFIGSVVKGSQVSDRRPFMIKLNDQGIIQVDKIFDMTESGFCWLTKNTSGSLQLFGDTRIFGTKRQKIFTITTDKNGNPVSK